MKTLFPFTVSAEPNDLDVWKFTVVETGQLIAETLEVDVLQNMTPTQHNLLLTHLFNLFLQ